MLKFVLRWGVFAIGVAWIVMQLTIRDRVHVVTPDGSVKSCALADAADENSDRFVLEEAPYEVTRQDVVSRPDRRTVPVHRDLADPDSEVVDVRLLGLELIGDPKAPAVRSLMIARPDGGPGGLRIRPDEVVGEFRVKTPRPVVEKGLLTMGRNANPWLLALSIAVFPLTMLITTFRWKQILRSQDIHLPFKRVFVLNMVGNFYNSFLPGSTGGDFLKAYYASRQTTHKIRAAVSVFVDRVIGLLALVILGGAMALYGFLNATDLHAFAQDLKRLREFSPGAFLEGGGQQLFVSLSPMARACLGVAAVCLLICAGALTGSLLLASKRARHWLGFHWFLARLPMQHHLNKVRESMRLYRRNAKLVPWWILITLPIHSTVVVSAMIAGQAFDLNISLPYYFVCVPVMVLVASLPISPQGAGVMEYFGFLLLAKQGATISEVLALTLSIRFVQIFWNLVGGLFVIRGRFEAPPAGYDAIADEDEDPEPSDDAAPRLAGTFADQGPVRS